MTPISTECEVQCVEMFTVIAIDIKGQMEESYREWRQYRMTLFFSCDVSDLEYIDKKNTNGVSGDNILCV